MVQLLPQESGRSGAFSSDFHALSHDVRTPLNHIHGFAELLLLDGGLSSTQTSYVEAILSGSRALQETMLPYLDRTQAPSPAEA